MDASKMKKVAVVGTVGVPACYGGFESLVQNLVDYQSDKVQNQNFSSSKKKPHKLNQ
ncbi:glycosyl transferase [Enterobacter cloacae]|nr:glycosyl transferase [Enterobacter cloacae]